MPQAGGEKNKAGLIIRPFVIEGLREQRGIADFALLFDPRQLSDRYPGDSP